MRLTTAHGSVVTAGTVFDCRLIADSAVVRLAEGRVRVTTGTGAERDLLPGQATVVRLGFPPAAPLPVSADQVWTDGDPDAPVADRVLSLPWRFVPGLVPGQVFGSWHSLPDGTQACTAAAMEGKAWGADANPDHEVRIQAKREGAAMLQLAPGSVVRLRVRAERTGKILLTLGAPPPQPGQGILWTSSASLPVEAGVWRDVAVPVADFWSPVKMDWESAAISTVGCWGFGAGAFTVSSVEIRLK
jgi:hypothetical protein